MKRRRFLQFLGSVVTGSVLAGAEQAAGGLLSSPVATNRLRPPGAVPEEIFAGKCIRCGRCVEVCPYHCITLLDIRAGVFAGTPLIDVTSIPCYLCMKCVDVCPTGSLLRVRLEETRMGLAVINKFTCTSWSGLTLCRTCFDRCPLKGTAIDLKAFQPVVINEGCTGCGLCTHACPVTTATGEKAINIEPLYAGDKVPY